MFAVVVNLGFEIDIKLGLTGLTNILNHLYLGLRLLFSAFVRSHPDIRGILEPDGAVLVLDEFTFHSNNFVLVEFRDVVADFVDLLQTISLFIMADEIDVFSNGPEIVTYLIIYILSVDVSVKFDGDW